MTDSTHPVGQIGLHEMFMNDFADGSIGQELQYEMPGENRAGVAELRAFFNHDTRVRYAAIFIRHGEFTPDLATSLTLNSAQLVQQIFGQTRITSSHPVFDPIGDESDDLLFTGRVFLYVDDEVPIEEQVAVANACRSQGIWPKFRDHRYKAFMNDGSKPLAFVSHDSRDKDELVRPLVERLGQNLCPVWYDEYALLPGNSLRESIDKGLSETSKCILVLSQNFLNNPGWTKGEFNAAMNKHFNMGGSVVIPIWHGVTRTDVAEYSALIADIVAIKSSDGLDEMARRLIRVLKP